MKMLNEDMIIAMGQVSEALDAIENTTDTLCEDDKERLQDIAVTAKIILRKANTIAGFDLYEDWKKAWIAEL